MGTRTIRRTSVSLPSLDEPGRYLSNVTSLEGGRGRVAEFHYGDAELRAFDLAGTHLMDGRVSGIRAQQVRWEDVRFDSVEWSGCDLTAFRWSGGKVSRTVFRDCKLLGAALDELTLDHVLFEHCKLDYGTFTRLRATGPLIFSRCSLRETTFAGSDLSGALFDNCDLRQTEFDGGKHRDLDLRGNDLSQLRGVASLKRVIIDRAQTVQLAEALAAELNLTYGDDLDDQ